LRDIELLLTTPAPVLVQWHVFPPHSRRSFERNVRP